ncbi:hypothetical protein PCC7418_2493 [Halothece sp. PCC 7418]|uniref:DUF4926 domain-containing protein n=1 Tax=Halothece sp. (strain PCC 7418) TaxID=65093 RepID=UPI0002A065E4|nr:DUF4926 domain-containing protein [Halothece sp. PCC 7418]AFZ44640.1 hypothetical protein PCC7418_2493 [Halothece sp. PCC 7418]
MIEPSLNDLVELLVNLPEYNLAIGNKGRIIDSLDESHFEIEFIEGVEEATDSCVLSTEQFIVVWQAETEEWLSTTDKLMAIVNNLPEEKREEILNFAQFLLQKI